MSLFSDNAICNKEIASFSIFLSFSFLEFLIYFMEVPKFFLFIFSPFLFHWFSYREAMKIILEYSYIYVSNFYIFEVVWFIFKIQIMQKAKHSKQYNLHPWKCPHRMFYQRKLLNLAIKIFLLLVITFFPFFHVHIDSVAKILVKYFNTRISSE